MRATVVHRLQDDEEVGMQMDKIKKIKELHSFATFPYSTTSSTSSSCDTELTKMDEQRLRDYIQQLRNDRSAVRMTVLELESVHIDPLCKDEPLSVLDAKKLDLENAVLMQELMAMKVFCSKKNKKCSI